jgi:predicted permease
MLRDLLFAARTLRKSPVFTLAAVVTIALGVGATTAIFSVADAALLRPLPYKDPDRLVVIYSDLRVRADYSMPSSNENYVDIRNGTRDAFEDIGAVSTGRQVVTGADGTPEQITVGRVTPNFFKVLGARVVVGRDFTEADGVPQPPPPANPNVSNATVQPRLPVMAILSYEYWRRRYGGDASVIGRDLNAGGAPTGQQIVGVLAPGFELLFPPADEVETHPDVWFAFRLAYNDANRLGYFLRPVGRLKPGVTLARAQAEVETVADHIRRNFPVYGTSGYYARLEPMHKALVSAVRPAILVLMGAVVFLLLIACSNVANLLLVRASVREPELAVRAAIGAGRWRLVRQMLVEALLLSAVGTLAGIGLAWAGIRELVAIAPANLPRLDAIRIDPIVLGVSAVAGLLSAIFFGLAPAWAAFRLDLMRVLRGSSRASGLRGGAALGGAVVVIEVALCFALLVGSGLMIRSFVDLQRIDPGFDRHNLLTFQVVGNLGPTPEARDARLRQIADRLGGISGVRSVTAAFPLPLSGNFSTIRWGREDALADNTKYQATDFEIVRPGYFAAIGTRLLEGRTFTEDDNDPKRNVVIVDRDLAQKAFPGESAVGKRILIRIRTPEPEFVQIVGVVEHQRAESLAEPGREQVYFTDGFLGHFANRWAIRTNSDPAAYASQARAAVAAVDPKLYVADIATMDELVGKAQAATRFSLLLISVFAVMATLLVGVGLYGVLSTVVRQRTAEIGVRMALGASSPMVLRLVIGQGLRLSGAGIAVGLLAAFGLTRLMATMLVGVTPTDPATFVGMGVVFFTIAALSSWLPARRAASLDPTIALREP